MFRTHDVNFLLCLIISYATIVKCSDSVDSETDSLPYIPNYSETTFGYPPVDFKLADAKPEDVSFHLFSNTYKNGTYITFANLEEININTSLPTKFLIHGWFENETTYWYDLMKNEYFKKGDYNVIYVDWRKPARKTISVSAANAKPVGFVIADLIIKLKLDLKKTHLIGHSFGSHAAGFAGKRIFEESKEKISRITATDPAREYFEHELVGEDSRLSRFDADFVDVFHTDIEHYGFMKPIGFVDFYFNGGKIQPGCPLLSLKIDDNCHHTRSNVYYAESINSNRFLVYFCTFEKHNLFQKMENRIHEGFLGENIPDPEHADGIYCLNTNDRSPFALG